MPNVGMEPIRRKQLIQATIASIHEFGFADTTISRIAKTAGVSTGIVHHYFLGKADLLEATMRWLMTDLRRQVVDRLNRAAGPHERLAAIIEGNFAPGQFSAESVAARVAELALGLAALIDGLSVRCALDSGNLTRDAAARVVHDYLAAGLAAGGAGTGAQHRVKGIGN